MRRMTFEWRPGEFITHTVMITACTLCGDEVTDEQIARKEGFPTRIGGDSANGYELYHKACCSL